MSSAPPAMHEAGPQMGTLEERLRWMGPCADPFGIELDSLDALDARTVLVVTAICIGIDLLIALV